ncbi:universal stress protein [Inquilinus sp. OTU3971]|uniref:universal stress protein n=1 Tax=Inquilinus sp. OTU3971 TaxID=3043855 RepID=UPI00313DFC55
MPYKDVLVHVGTTETPALAAAIGFARRHDARLIGLGVQNYAYVGMCGIEPIPPSVIAALENAAAAELAATRSRFDKTVDRYGYTDRSEWRAERGIMVESIGFNGRYADVIVVDQTNPSHDYPPFGLPAELALGSGRPVMVIPFIGVRGAIGERVAVAWNASREAARAVSDAMPVLVKAQRVDVLAVDHHRADRVPGLDIARHLAAHGVTANVVAREKVLDPASEILNFLAENDSDLLVMGCYGHIRLHEVIFGGVSQAMLKSMTVPVLMSH